MSFWPKWRPGPRCPSVCKFRYWVRTEWDILKRFFLLDHNYGRTVPFNSFDPSGVLPWVTGEKNMFFPYASMYLWWVLGKFVFFKWWLNSYLLDEENLVLILVWMYVCVLVTYWSAKVWKWHDDFVSICYLQSIVYKWCNELDIMYECWKWVK